MIANAFFSITLGEIPRPVPWSQDFAQKEFPACAVLV
jgi:hypothetical protein